MIVAAISTDRAARGGKGAGSVAVLGADGGFVGRVAQKLAATVAARGCGTLAADGRTLHLLRELPTVGDAMARAFSRGTESQIRRGLRGFDHPPLRWKGTE